MKKKFLAVYDYGAGGVWRYIYAENENQIDQKYPGLTVLSEKPDWWDNEMENNIREFDIDDEPDEFMAKMTEQD